MNDTDLDRVRAFGRALQAFIEQNQPDIDDAEMRFKVRTLCQVTAFQASRLATWGVADPVIPREPRGDSA